jgi:dTDP-4-amino-4,6-dideoxygalactose transaminase
MVGAIPVLADIDTDTQNITVQSIRSVLSNKTRAIIPVHLGGWPCDMPAIMELAKECGLYVIEDCAQAHGAKFNGRPVGSFGHAAAFSFCQDKIITTGGEGGMLVLDDETVWKRAWAFKDHGKSYDAVYNREHAPGFRWLHESFGTNWRMLEFQAVIGRIQLARLEIMRADRTRNAKVLYETCRHCSALRTPWPEAHLEHAFYRFYTFIKAETLKQGWDRDRIMAELWRRGVPVSVGSCPEIYREKAFLDAGLAPTERLPVAKEVGETSLAFLVHPTLTDDNMRSIGAEILDVMSQATAS